MVGSSVVTILVGVTQCTSSALRLSRGLCHVCIPSSLCFCVALEYGVQLVDAMGFQNVYISERM